MRLIDKKEIAQHKSSERKQEIEEGVKLAKSVDSLRETLSKEQANLKKFRDETLKGISLETEGFKSKKETLVKEIQELESRRRLAEAPIDLTNEWKKVEETRKDLLQRETNLISREILVQDLEKREKIVSDKEKEAEKFLEGARKSYQKTDDLRHEMESKKKEAELLIKEKSDHLESTEKDLVSRELLLKQQKTQLFLDQDDLLKKGTDLIERESKVESQIKSFVVREEDLKQKEELTARLNVEASKKYEKSEVVLVESERFKSEFEKDFHERSLKLSERERDVGYRERDLILERESIENQKKEIETEKVHIASQQLTLKSAWDNIKKLQDKK